MDQITLSKLETGFQSVINSCSAGNESNTPDWLLAGVAVDAIRSFNQGTIFRDKWYGLTLEPGMSDKPSELARVEPLTLAKKIAAEMAAHMERF